VNSWFERITGFQELPYQQTKALLQFEGERLRNAESGCTWGMGRLEVPTLGELRARVAGIPASGHLRASVVQSTIEAVHANPANRNALIQAASQFNLLEMVHQDVTPEQGITQYAQDKTQGPACAVSAGAGAVYRNYLMELPGGHGQTRDRQVDCLADIGTALGNLNQRLWTMRNGYAMFQGNGLEEVDSRLKKASRANLDEWRSLIRIGVHWDVQVTLPEAPPDQYVSQAYCSALPVSYNPRQPAGRWVRFSRLVLEAAYEATMLAAVLNGSRAGCALVYLTRVGGGAFGNHSEWILAAMHRAFHLMRDRQLDVKLVTLGPPGSDVKSLVKEFQ
jgi:hypothetical protein